MRRDSDERTWLEDAFSILQLRRRTLVSFRQFVILHARQARPGNANALRAEDATAQPLRVVHR
jgi:hypothetical protein